MQPVQAQYAAHKHPCRSQRDTTFSRPAQCCRVLSMGCRRFAPQSVEDGSDTPAERCAAELNASVPHEPPQLGVGDELAVQNLTEHRQVLLLAECDCSFGVAHVSPWFRNALQTGSRGIVTVWQQAECSRRTMNPTERGDQQHRLLLSVHLAERNEFCGAGSPRTAAIHPSDHLGGDRP